MATEAKIECPKCHSTSVTWTVVTEDNRAAFLELNVTCPKCSRTWRMFFEHGRHVKTLGPWPATIHDLAGTREIPDCPLCGRRVHEPEIRHKTYCLGYEFAVLCHVHRACYDRLPGGPSEKTKLVEAELLKQYASGGA